MSKFFGSVNDVDSHNKSCQSDLALEKFWVTQCGWLRLYATVAMGTKINNSWKLFHYRVKRDHYNKFIGIREFSEKSLLIDSIIISQHTQGSRKTTYLTLMKFITKELCIPVEDSTIPVIILTIQRSAQYRI